MPRSARCVVPGLPHHVTQRGNRRQQTFFSPSDYRLYQSLMRKGCDEYGVRVWAYCLMPNHVHLILEPSSPESLRKAVGWAHQRYTWVVNRRMRWAGYLWQGRFWSCPLDERHLHSAVRYVLQNPVRSGLVEQPQDWPHSSTNAHLGSCNDGLVDIEPLGAKVDDWEGFLAQSGNPTDAGMIRRYSRAGLPLGSMDFVAKIERCVGRSLRLRPRGRPRKGGSQ